MLAPSVDAAGDGGGRSALDAGGTKHPTTTDDASSPPSPILDAAAAVEAASPEALPWQVVRPARDPIPEIRAPFGAADGFDYRVRTCAVGDASCVREAAKDEWLDMSATSGVTADARAGYLQRVGVADAAAWSTWLSEQVGDLPRADEITDDEELIETVRSILRTAYSRWPLALHKTTQEFDEEVDIVSVQRSAPDSLYVTWAQRIDGIEVAWDVVARTLSLDWNWRPTAWPLPAPSKPLRDWVRRFGPVPDADEVRTIVVDELPSRYAEDYEEYIFGNLVPESIDWQTVTISGPIWYWGSERRTFAADDDYWRVAYSVKLYANFCEHYFVTGLSQPVQFSGDLDAGVITAHCEDNPG
jgi:hypothetical protein